MSHTEPHPLAGTTVQVVMTGHSTEGVSEFLVEDWWDTLTGGSWMFAKGNPAATIYGIRSGVAGLPIDNEVVYGKIGPFGYLVHTSEIMSDS